MKRLNSTSLPAFIATPGIGALLLGSDDTPTMAWAEDFALLWAECMEHGRDDIRFGYAGVDADIARENSASTHHPPMVMIIENGETAWQASGRDWSEQIRSMLRLDVEFKSRGFPFSA